MRLWIFLFAASVACAQTPDPAYEPLNKAYEALRARDYDKAVALFLKAIQAAPSRPAIHKDLAYTYLKIGENTAARDQFREAMLLDPKDLHVALEYAFLCYETKQQAQARRVFDRVRKTGDPESRATAERAFQNIDRPLAEGIARWTKAIQLGSGNFSSHFELATLAEQRDELELAAEHYEKAWRLLPDRRSVLVDLGRVLKELNRTEQANAALLAASRGGEPRAAEAARELLPNRYPYVSEFERALDLDPNNLDLRRELAYLLLRMKRQAEAEQEFRKLSKMSETDYLSAAQLGFLLLARGDTAEAMPLLERVMKGADQDLANRVRAVLHVPQTLRTRPAEPAPRSIDAKVMAERSLQAGFIRDALKYLQLAQEDDPADFAVMLKLGWAYNLLHNDRQAIRWFDLARKSPDPKIAKEANTAYRNLRPSFETFRTTVWTYPLYSSRWRDFFSYAQIKTELRLDFPIHPYVSLRFVGDTRGTINPENTGIPPQYLSESALIPGLGVATSVWHGLMGWAEAGSSVGYLSHHILPDYRGGLTFSKGFGHLLKSKTGGAFFETNDDAIFVSRFDNDSLIYSQNRFGYTPSLGALQTQFYWNVDLTMDQKREPWANFLETGPGVRFRVAAMPSSLYLTVNYLRGRYTIAGDPFGPSFNDIRAGFWYAFTY
ncbi:MAG TPA: tetratricopeptide repeat protein [Bryobacteraceae bacterium]|nr:tetratricopeptide repeat protein [Bryobacteraceae bacterium]